MTSFYVYLIVMLDSFIGLAATLTAFGLIMMVPRFVEKFYNDCSSSVEQGKRNRTYLKIGAALVIPCSLFLTFMPNTQQAAVIYVLPYIIKNKDIQNIPHKLDELANMWMKQQIKNQEPAHQDD